MKVMEKITRWLRWASRQPLPDNRAADAAIYMEAQKNEVQALAGMIKTRDAELQRCYKTISAARGLLRDIHSDLGQTARRSGFPDDWNSAEIRAVTIERLVTLYGKIGKIEKGSDNG